ncbi:hypothetical protein UFOVP621_92 [uncultured Caudovirales phage]|uniref:Uncharacterized protein n=1 Tax=uncultured Caudovirales phage TaxID=2100421 RepID=A0A6J5N7E2_9CAUD|nr:hypothetical protein UFOVP621_92 [uncultured Caudovirales phage]
MNRSGVKDYASAEAWLLGARSTFKTERSLYEPGLRLVRINKETIAVRIKGWGVGIGDCIVYKSDGSTIIHKPYAAYQSVRRVYMEYVPNLKMVVRNGNLILSLPSDGTTPSKLQNCRKCGGGGTVPGNCWGPNSCIDENCELQQAVVAASKLLQGIDYVSNRDAWDEAQNVMWEARSQHKHAMCVHGHKQYHVTPKERNPCWNCNSTGKKEYGNKRKGRVWSENTPIGIDANGDYFEV